MKSHKRPLEKDDTDLAACRAKRARLADELRQLDATIKRLSAGGASDDDDVHPPSPPSCPDCQTGAVERTAKTEKNAGRKFWSCPKGCKTWIGWVPGKATPSAEKDREDYTCKQCGRRLTVAAEVTLNMKRLGVPHFANDIRRELTRELEESMANGDYVCELCLGHA